MAAIRSRAPLFRARPSIDRLRVMAGSVVWKNRSTSGSPPRSRMLASPFDLGSRSTTYRKPSQVRQEVVQPMISGSVLAIHRLPL